ncbi:MAG TPA: tetratricopeptide repeat protein [Rudaea sp.]|jgi:CRISPR-associated protein Csy1|nr:tetratricopeptide repeat protein [Rudaea sp.]
MSAAETDAALQAGLRAFADGDFALALGQANLALAATPRSGDALSLRVNALLKLERWRDAVGDLESLIILDPHQPKLRRLLGLCWLRIGNACKSSGDDAGAVDAYRHSIRADSLSQDARHNLGTLLLRLERFADALPMLASVVAAEPGNEEAALDLARAELATGAEEAAVARLVALARQSARDDVVEAVAGILLDAGRIDESLAAALRIADSTTPNLDAVLHHAKRLRDNAAMPASATLLDALARKPLGAAARLRVDLHVSLGLPAVYSNADAIVAARTHLARGIDYLASEYPPSRIAQIAPGPETLLWDNFYLAYQGRNDRDLQHAFGAWYCAALGATIPATALARPARQRPRIAMVSGRFHRCTVGMYFSAWIEYLSSHGWEVILVHVGGYRDDWTEHLARCAHGEVTLTGAFADRARRLSELDADLALYPELGMDSSVLGLAALRLARVQVCAWGHPSTTGLPTIDAFLSCADMEPADAAAHYTEPLRLLPGLGTRYPPPPVPGRSPRATSGLPDDRRLYLVPQSLFKLHPDNDAVLAHIVENDANALLVLFAGSGRGATDSVRKRLVAALRDVAGQPDKHLLFLGQRTREEYLRVNLACDVMVDSLHWSGGNTSLDALHCGLPVVTCPGALMRGRQSSAMLTAIDCAELIADSPRELAALCVEIANDPQRRAALGVRIRDTLQRLTASDEPLAALNDTLRQLMSNTSGQVPERPR